MHIRPSQYHPKPYSKAVIEYGTHLDLTVFRPEGTSGLMIYSDDYVIRSRLRIVTFVTKFKAAPTQENLVVLWYALHPMRTEAPVEYIQLLLRLGLIDRSDDLEFKQGPWSIPRGAPYEYFVWMVLIRGEGE
jgi:hypothetical protein